MWGTVIGVLIGVLAGGYVVFVIVKSAIDRKNGKTCCGDCHNCSSCHKKTEK
jgi:hypothetical protein